MDLGAAGIPVNSLVLGADRGPTDAAIISADAPDIGIFFYMSFEHRFLRK